MIPLNYTYLSPNGPQMARLLRGLQLPLQLPNPVISVGDLLKEAAFHSALLIASDFQLRVHGLPEHVEALVVLVKSHVTSLRLLVILVRVVKFAPEIEGGSPMFLSFRIRLPGLILKLDNFALKIGHCGA